MAEKISIEQLDKNMAIERTVDEPDICFYDVRKPPFDVYGLYNYREEPDFKRLPDAVAATVNEGVKGLNYATAGGRIRFCTDSQYVAIRAVMPHIAFMSHFALTGSSSFDLYIDDPDSGISRFHRPFRIATDAKNGYESILKFSTKMKRYFTINFPSYSHVKDLFIGLQEDAMVGEGLKYRDIPPVVYYGSSITQGACASRPGNAYQNVIARRMNLDFINLGFSGNGKAEDTIVEYMAGLKMSAFVSDYDHNAPSAQHLKDTHERFYRIIREKNPDLPIVFATAPDFHHRPEVYAPRRAVIMENYVRLCAEGDKNLYFVDGASFYQNTDYAYCTVDGCHPNDCGFYHMALAFLPTLRKILK